MNSYLSKLARALLIALSLFLLLLPSAEASRFGGGNGGKRSGQSGPVGGQNLNDESSDYSELDHAGQAPDSGSSTYGDTKRKLRSGEQSDD